MGTGASGVGFSGRVYRFDDKRAKIAPPVIRTAIYHASSPALSRPISAPFIAARRGADGGRYRRANFASGGGLIVAAVRAGSIVGENSDTSFESSAISAFDYRSINMRVRQLSRGAPRETRASELKATSGRLPVDVCQNPCPPRSRTSVRFSLNYHPENPTRDLLSLIAPIVR